MQADTDGGTRAAVNVYLGEVRSFDGIRQDKYAAKLANFARTLQYEVRVFL